MARRDIEMFDLIELYTHWQAGRSQVQLQYRYSQPCQVGMRRASASLSA